MNNIKLSTSYFILSNESNLANQYLAVSFRLATEIIDKAKQKIMIQWIQILCTLIDKRN